VVKHCENVAHGSGQCPIPGNIPCLVGQGSEQPYLIEDVPAYCRSVAFDDL